MHLRLLFFDWLQVAPKLTQCLYHNTNTYLSPPTCMSVKRVVYSSWSPLHKSSSPHNFHPWQPHLHRSPYKFQASVCTLHIPHGKGSAPRWCWVVWACSVGFSVGICVLGLIFIGIVWINDVSIVLSLFSTCSGLLRIFWIWISDCFAKMESGW